MSIKFQIRNYVQSFIFLFTKLKNMSTFIFHISKTQFENTPDIQLKIYYHYTKVS